MNIGKQLSEMSDSVDLKYKFKFISKTQEIIDSRASAAHAFLDASLTFQDGSAVWRQDLPIFDLDKPESPTNPIINPEIPVESPGHAYDLFKNYFNNVRICKKGSWEMGLEGLEKYCNN